MNHKSTQCYIMIKTMDQKAPWLLYQVLYILCMFTLEISEWFVIEYIEFPKLIEQTPK